MRKLLYILLFIPILNNAQYNTVVDLDKDTVESGSGNVVLDLSKVCESNSVDSTLLLSYDAQYLKFDSLTYNSTGDTVTTSNADTVWIDNVDSHIVGNSGRFGSPTSGTVYTILEIYDDTAFILDQTFTGSVGDEFYFGCDGSLDDQSIYENTGMQTTGVKQVRALRTETDTARWKFDGDDDFVSIDTTQTVNLDSGAISMWIKFGSDLGSGDYLISYADYGSTQHVWGLKLSSKKVQIYVRESGDQTITGGTTLSINTWYHIVAMSNGSNYSIYVNNSSESLTGTNDGDWFGDVTEKDGCVFGVLKYGSADVAEYHGEIDEVKIYNRTLTETEITELYTTGKHYTP